MIIKASSYLLTYLVLCMFCFWYQNIVMFALSLLTLVFSLSNVEVERVETILFFCYILIYLRNFV